MWDEIKVFVRIDFLYKVIGFCGQLGVFLCFKQRIDDYL